MLQCDKISIAGKWFWYVRLGNIPLKNKKMQSSFNYLGGKRNLLGNTSSLFAVTGSCVGTILTLFCCLFLSGIPRLCFAHFENVLLSERLGCRQGAADMLKARWPKSTWWLTWTWYRELVCDEQITAFSLDFSSFCLDGSSSELCLCLDNCSLFLLLNGPGPFSIQVY